ncbi:MAG: oxidative damage protection protein [Betaproteobacteria bacterium]|nr:oxidative damage protection protein [Betaproteobacteria bacterium]
MSRTVHCVKLGCEAEGMERPPLPGALGQKIFENVSKEAWQQWVRLQTMIINENRLNLADASHREYLTGQLENHFFGEGM